METTVTGVLGKSLGNANRMTLLRDRIVGMLRDRIVGIGLYDNARSCIRAFPAPGGACSLLRAADEDGGSTRWLIDLRGK